MTKVRKVGREVRAGRSAKETGRVVKKRTVRTTPGGDGPRFSTGNVRRRRKIATGRGVEAGVEESYPGKPGVEPAPANGPVYLPIPGGDILITEAEMPLTVPLPDIDVVSEGHHGRAAGSGPGGEDDAWPDVSAPATDPWEGAGDGRSGTDDGNEGEDAGRDFRLTGSYDPSPRDMEYTGSFAPGFETWQRTGGRDGWGKYAEAGDAGDDGPDPTAFAGFSEDLSSGGHQDVSSERSHERESGVETRGWGEPGPVWGGSGTMRGENETLSEEPGLPGGKVRTAGPFMADEETDVFTLLKARPLIVVMQVVATAALITLFLLNYLLNPGAFEVLGSFSSWVAGQPPAAAAALATFCGLFFVALPHLEESVRTTIYRSAAIIVAVAVFMPVLVVYGATSDGGAAWTGLVGNLRSLAEVILVVAYWAPVTFGVFGIWTRRPAAVSISAAFMLSVPVLADAVVLLDDGLVDKGASQLPAYVAFAVLLFCYTELADGSTRYLNLTAGPTGKEETAGSPDLWEEAVLSPHPGRILGRYFTYMLVFCILCALVVFFTFSTGPLLEVTGSSQVARSLELTSVYGLLLSFIVTGTVIFIIATCIRYEAELSVLGARLSGFRREDDEAPPGGVESTRFPGEDLSRRTVAGSVAGERNSPS